MTTSAQELARALQNSGVLTFGPEGEPLILKDGSESYYFYNLGNCADPVERLVVARAIAEKLQKFGFDNFDAIFGPAYKGIGLAFDDSMILFLEFNQIKPVIFNRKEAKDHGEGGVLIGTKPVPGLRVVVLDDVVTSGATKGEAVGLMRDYKMVPVFVLVVIMRAPEGVIEVLAEQLGIPIGYVGTHQGLLPHFAGVPDYVTR